jgi:hypothetical protein
MDFALNRFALNALTRKQRPYKPPSVKPTVVSRGDDLQLAAPQYFMAHLHLARCWNEQLWFELEWFLASMRGELPPPHPTRRKNYHIQHITLPPNKYYLALAAITTRLGVKLNAAR